jgi:hypothetical protein
MRNNAPTTVKRARSIASQLSTAVSKLTISLVGLASLVLVACGGSSTSSPSATSAAAVDACLVGMWTTVALSENSPANDESITYSGGAGEVFTINAQGAVTIDTHAVRPIVFVSAGQRFTGTVTGTGRGTLRTSGTMFTYTPSAGDTFTTTSFGPDGVPLGPARADSAFTAVYTCTPGQSFTFYKTAVNFMIDGPKVTLTAGVSNPSSTATPTPT